MTVCRIPGCFGQKPDCDFRPENLFPRPSHEIPWYPRYRLFDNGIVKDSVTGRDVPTAKTLIRKRPYILVHTLEGHSRVYLDVLMERYFGDKS